MMDGKPYPHYLAPALFIGVLALAAGSPVRAQTQPAQNASDKGNAGQSASTTTGASVAVTPTDGSGPATRPGVDRSSVFRLLLHANPMLWPLAICSIVTLGYVMERF